MRDFQVYVEDIIAAIDSIEAYTKGMTYEGFVSDKKTIDAVIRNFEIIGEATKHIPNSKAGVPQSALERYGWNERQINSWILRRSVRRCLEDS